MGLGVGDWTCILELVQGVLQIQYAFSTWDMKCRRFNRHLSNWDMIHPCLR